ncbi:MAG: hypothetical protein AB7P33_03085 [Dehalococcoidia bacterium]
MPSNASTAPAAASITVTEAGRHLGRPAVAPTYLPASVASGPEIALEPGGEVYFTYYGSDRRAVLKISESTTGNASRPQTGWTVVTLRGVDVALLLEANLARFQDGTIARHAYAEFTTQGLSITVEYFAPTSDTPEQMGAELAAIATSMLP